MKKNKYVHIKEEHNTRASSIVVPEFIKLYSPKSVVDIGCGLGTWLKVFADNNITDLVGYDGAHLDMSKVEIPKEMIITTDLEKEIISKRRFDLAISLEVAEHITPKNASTFVKSICNLSQTIVFSAAIPWQGGQNHLNEQWPSYWQDLFFKNGYTMHDVLRETFWENEEIDYWYKQNMFLVTGPASPFYKSENKPLKRLVHPDLLHIYHDLFWNTVEGKAGKTQALKSLVKSIIR